MHDLKTGDVVLCQETGQLMTVGDVVESRVWCQWFEGNTLHSGLFSIDVLDFIR